MSTTEVEFLSVTMADEAKRQLCIELLAEFGVTNYRESFGELTHQCTLPFGGHSDGNSWTASVNYQKLAFNCFVCGYGGPLTWWIAVNRGLDTDQAAHWLQNRTGSGTVVPLETRQKIIESIIHPPENKPGPMPFYNDALLKRWNDWAIFHPYLTDPISQGGREIPIENLEKFEIGYADEDEDFHYFRRIIIPVRWGGKIVGWQARRLDEADPDFEIKYKNSPLLPRDRILYGDVGARVAVAVESPLSVLRHTHQCAIVSTFGSKLTDPQVRLLQKFERLILFPDPDKAGRQWTRRIINGVSRHTRVDVVMSPYAKVDAADIGDGDFESMIQDSTVTGALWAPKPYNELIEYKKGIS